MINRPCRQNASKRCPSLASIREDDCQSFSLEPILEFPSAFVARHQMVLNPASVMASANVYPALNPRLRSHPADHNPPNRPRTYKTLTYPRVLVSIGHPMNNDRRHTDNLFPLASPPLRQTRSCTVPCHHVPHGLECFSINRTPVHPPSHKLTFGDFFAQSLRVPLPGGSGCSRHVHLTHVARSSTPAHHVLPGSLRRPPPNT